MTREFEERGVEADGVAAALQPGALEIVVEQHPRHTAEEREGLGAPRWCGSGRALAGLDGGIESNIDGGRARKFVRLWRVQFSSLWNSQVAP
jgi:hypothetical protein